MGSLTRLALACFVILLATPAFAQAPATVTGCTLNITLAPPAVATTCPPPVATPAPTELGTPLGTGVTMRGPLVPWTATTTPNVQVPIPSTGAVYLIMPLRHADGTVGTPVGIDIVPIADPALVQLKAAPFSTTDATLYIRVEEPGKAPVLLPILVQSDAAPPAPSASGWTLCAQELGQCAFTGTRDVRYGVTGRYNTKTLTGGTPCTNAVFGDPAIGQAKHCDVK